jgi:hypothetical protein
MNFLVLPFSAVPKSPFSLALFLNGVFGHAILVGFPIAWFAYQSAGKEHTSYQELRVGSCSDCQA